MAERALKHAVTVFPDADITVIYVIDFIEESYGGRALVGTEALIERGTVYAEELFEAARTTAAEHGVEIETATEVGRPSRQIVAYAEEHDVDGIVMGSHGRSPLTRVLLGSVAEHVVRRAPVPVTIVR